MHLDTFRNIDLFFQGLYYVKVSVYTKKADDVSTLAIAREGYEYRCLPAIPRNILIFIIHSNLGQLCEPVLYFYIQNA